MINNKHVIKAV